MADVQQGSATPKREPVKVLVLMPFSREGPADAAKTGAFATLHHSESVANPREERAVLEFLALKHIVRRINQDLATNAGAGEPHHVFELKICRTFAQEIPELLREVTDAEIVVAMLRGRNVNVMFEAVTRYLLKGRLILLTRDDDRAEIPIYMQNKAYVLNEFPQEVEILIERIIGNNILNNPQFEDSPDVLPRPLQDLLDGRDLRLRTDLAGALVEVMSTQPVAYAREHLSHVWNGSSDHHLSISYWAKISYFPVAIIRAQWKANPRRKIYSFQLEDLEGDPVVIDANRRFWDLCNLDAGPEAVIPVTVAVGLLKDNMDDSSSYVHEFEEDQTRVFVDVMLKNRVAHARVPIRMKNSHPRFPGGAEFLPCYIAKTRTVDILNIKHAHETYLMVGYVSGLSAGQDTVVSGSAL